MPKRSLLRWAARAVFGTVAAAWIVLLLAWLTLHWGILPRIEQWRPQIEARASRALGIPVRIGQISLRSSGWVPAIELRDVLLLDAQQRPALRLPRVAASLSPRSLLGFELRFEQLLIDGAQLEVRRDPAGRLYVGGLDIGAAGGDDSAAADWFFHQREFVIRGGTLRWTDEQRAAPPLALTDVQLVVRNGLRSHQLRFDATPPADWGERFSLRGRFSQPLLARAGDWRRWSGSAYASLPRADVSELRRHVDLPFELSEGDGALRGWFELIDGEPRGATVDLALRAVSLRLAREVETLRVEQVEGRVVGQRTSGGLTLALQNFGFLTGDEIRWPRGKLQLGLRQKPGEAVSGGDFSAEQLNLETINQIATRVPLGSAVQRLLTELNPRGNVSALDLRWQGPLDAPQHYQVHGLLSEVSLSARVSPERDGIGRPGLRNATLRLDATEAGGQAQLSLRDGALELPGVFAEALLPIDQLQAELSWKVDKVRPGALPKVTVQVKDMRLNNADAQADVSATWSTGPGNGMARGGRYPGLLELDGRVGRALAMRTARYLPLGIPEELRRYVARAVRGGTLDGATFRVKGDLWDFPFYRARTQKDGEFRIVAKAEDVSFAYVPSVPVGIAEPAFVSPWPALTRVYGELVIDRSTLSFQNVQARLGGADWSGVRGSIDNLAEHSLLTLEAAGRGPLAEMLNYVNGTPIGGWIGGSLAATAASGSADLRLGLSIPLDDVDATTAKGILQLAGNDLRFTPDTPLLGAARGRIDFTQKGITVTGASARTLGGDLAFDGGTQADGSLRFNGQGTASADGLRRAPELGLLSRVAGALGGQAAYRINLGFLKGASEINVTSNLVGISADLPAPLNKVAETPLALRYQTTLAPTGAPRDSLRFELGALVQAHYERELTADAALVRRGSVAIGAAAAAPMPAAGVAAQVSAATLDLDAWQAVAARFAASGSGSGGSGSGSASVDTGTSAGDYAPDSIALQAQRLLVGGREFDRLVAGLSFDAGLWRANLDADQMNGYLEYRPPRAGAAATAGGRVYARLARLQLPKSEIDRVESLLDEQSADTVPALDIVVEDFELRGRRLGRVEIAAANRAGESRDAPRVWHLSKFNLITPEAQLTATGDWLQTGGPGAPAGPRRRAVMDFSLALRDAGALLERLGSGKVIRGGKGQLSGQVSWLGSPLTLDYASMSGHMNLSVDAGQFLKADAGAARLLGVLSLQSLPRRLALDFRDVFQEGFAFDNITGDIQVTQGVAYTNNLRMLGVQAAVLMEGSADLERETQDLRVIVVPEINAGTASLAYAVINPAIGLGTFLAQALLRGPLIAAGTREFHVTGPWADPKVDRIARRPGDPVPNVEPPPVAASAPPANR